MTTRAYRLKLSPAAADSPGLVESAVRVCGVRRAYWSWATYLARHRPYLQLLERCVPLDGDVIECGVFRGKSLLRIATWLNQQGVRKTVYGLDSFDGFPVDGIGEVDLGPGRTPQRVRRRFRGAQGAPGAILRTAEDLNLPIKLRIGLFDETLPRLIGSGKKFCFVHIDCDIYESYRHCLEKLYDATVPGGIILFDEYRCSSWPGATRAVDEFFANKTEKPAACHDPGRPSKPKYYVMKQLTQRAALRRAA